MPAWNPAAELHSLAGTGASPSSCVFVCRYPDTCHQSPLLHADLRQTVQPWESLPAARIPIATKEPLVGQSHYPPPPPHNVCGCTWSQPLHRRLLWDPYPSVHTPVVSATITACPGHELLDLKVLLRIPTVPIATVFPTVLTKDHMGVHTVCSSSLSQRDIMHSCIHCCHMTPHLVPYMTRPRVTGHCVS